MTIDCSWHHPGADPYSGGPKAAIVRYVNAGVMSAATGQKLFERMDKVKPDRGVDITRDGITGGFEPAITMMHFGKGRVCDTVDRSGWTAWERQPALIYCEDGVCLIEPVICHNISIVKLQADSPPAAFTFDAPSAGEVSPGPIAISTDAFVSGVEAEPVPVGYGAGGGGYPAFGGGGFGGGPSFGPMPPVIYPPGVISPVPEPSTWAMLALGLGGVALLSIRRHGSPVAAMRSGLVRVLAVLVGWLVELVLILVGFVDRHSSPADKERQTAWKP